jgi:hypothetical protein
MTRYIIRLIVAATLGAIAAALLCGCQAGPDMIRPAGDVILRAEASEADSAAPPGPAWKVSIEWKIASR